MGKKLANMWSGEKEDGRPLLDRKTRVYKLLNVGTILSFQLEDKVSYWKGSDSRPTDFE